jgi:3-deoxy-7-phosphoheptulonate synthase
VPRKQGWWDLTCHLPWIGERTRDLRGAHVEFFRGIENPVGVKIGPNADPAEVVELCRTLNPHDKPGKLVLIHRMGAEKCEARLPPILAAVLDSGARVLWTCDPMHGNTRLSAPAEPGQLPVKTRRFDDILSELEIALDVHERVGTRLGGVHFEMTGEDVTECVGGGAGVTDEDLGRNYASLCDPRLNYQQALELAFLLAKRLPA